MYLMVHQILFLLQILISMHAIIIHTDTHLHAIHINTHFNAPLNGNNNEIKSINSINKKIEKHWNLFVIYPNRIVMYKIELSILFAHDQINSNVWHTKKS